MRTLVLGLALALGAGGCSSDDSSGNPSGGAGGTGASGGSGGSGGSGASGGSGGSGGVSGSATGGVSGGGGSGGQAGTASMPDKLSETGLYSDITTETLGPGVMEYQPRFVLWSDSATKKRWVYLPPGSKIDTSDMNYWTYPIGTKLWKEFTRDGTRVETRLIQKNGTDDWFMMAYQWNSQQDEAMAVPAGVPNAAGTPHDIPNTDACLNCHGKTKDRVLGFSAIQLSHQLGGMNLSDLASGGWLTNQPTGIYDPPGTATDQAALGYLHANCGLCHNENSFLFATVKMQLWLKVEELTAVTDTSTYKTTVNQATTGFTPTGTALRISPGSTANSDVHVRMSQRGTIFQMPPIGTEDVDPVGLKAVDDWINGL